MNMPISEFQECVSNMTRIDLEETYHELLYYYLFNKFIISKVLGDSIDTLSMQACFATSRSRVIMMSEPELTLELEKLFFVIMKQNQSTKGIILV